MGVIKTIWNASSWWSALLWFLCGGIASFIWGYIAIRNDNSIYWIIFVVFLVTAIYYLIKFLRVIFRKSKD